MTNQEHYPQPPAPPRFATYVPGRSPAWKYYANIGHAKSAMHSGAAGYQRFYLAELWIYDSTEDRWALAVSTKNLEFDTKYRDTGDQLRELMQPFTNKT